MHLLPEIKEVKAAPYSDILKLYASSYILNLHTQKYIFQKYSFHLPYNACIHVYRCSSVHSF